MPEKIQPDLLIVLTRQQNQLTIELTEWLIECYYQFPEEDRQGALLQRWVGLLVQSVLESLKAGKPGMVVDFVVVLRAQAQQFFDNTIWRAAFGWLGYRCHRLLKNGLDHSLLLSGENEEMAEDLFLEQRDTLTLILDRLDRALHCGVRELELSRPVLHSLLHLHSLSATEPASLN